MLLALAIYGRVEPRAAPASASRGFFPKVDENAIAPSVAAYELFVRGNDPLLLRSDSGLRTGIEYLDRAIALEPSYAQAYGAMAYLCATVAWSADRFCGGPPRHVPPATSAAHEAVALNDRLAAAHRDLGYVKMTGYDLTAATAELERAVALDPRTREAREDLAKAYEWSGRPNDAVTQTQLAVRAEPASASARAELGSALYFARRYDEALSQLAHVANLQPPLRRAPMTRAQIYASQGRWPEAITLLVADTLTQSRARGLLGFALARSGARAKALDILRPIARTAADSGHAFEVAEIYAGLGELDLAFRWLDRAFEDYSLSPSIMGPLFDGVRDDPRFARIRQRLHHPAAPPS